MRFEIVKQLKDEDFKRLTRVSRAVNVICRLKIFRILSERYRNYRKRFSLRFNLIATFYNLEILVA